MKFLVILSSLVALCAGHAIPTIPEDNSHYVEGESRYVWIPDGEGVPRLVDLEEPADESSLDARNGADNEYWLFTRRNPNNHQLLRINDDNSVRNSNYDRDRPLIVIVHGWSSSGNSPLNPLIRDALLHDGDNNVITLDWSIVASSPYTTSVRNVPSVGQHLGNFVQWLINNHGGNWDNVHLIGASLGAHVIGNAGRTVRGRIARISGLDPAGPQWSDSPNALNRNDGVYVECIHTDGGLLGILDPICGANFYPNGGTNRQPGCSLSLCSHDRAYELFAASVRYNAFIGRQCVDLNEARNNSCTGSNLPMGNTDFSKRGSGLYGLSTGSEWPF
ncbi:unnamed protein product [Colias eurytheme]|nr:unnamed protein product [Colias eurytheme]